MAPACACRSPSVAPSQARTSWCVCFTVATLSPRCVSSATKRSMSVVLPEFFQPTIPISGGPLATRLLRREKCARFLQILRRVHVEERIDRLAADLHERKIDDDAALRHGEAMHGANAL